MFELEKRIRNVLELYTLEEILEKNDLTPEEVLLELVELGLVQIPEEEPL